ncbi:MAG: hypothetical protein ACXW3C_03145, partial [Pyrinomonadaceae bacterium]
AQGSRTLTNFELTDTTITEHTATTRTYTKIGDTYYLTQVSGPMGINLVISRDDAGRVLRVANDPGQSLNFDWTEKRLTAVSDSAGRRVSFDYDGARLISVTDSAGAEWGYEYTNGLLGRTTDPMDRVILRVRYNKSGRVSAAGDSVGLTRYEYASGRTAVTDPLGAVTTYEHTDKGTLMAITDDEGRSVRIEYNAAGKAVQLSSSAGERATLNYDSQNRLVSQSVNGTVRAYSYGSDGRVSSMVDGNERADLTLGDRGQITGVQSTDPARSYTATYDAHGALTQLKSQSRNVAFEYDAQGNQTVLTYSDLGRFTYEWNTVGRVTGEHFPSGFSRFNEYDARGAFIKQSDNRGNAVTVQRDASGAPIAYIRADGKQMRAVRDDAGRVIRDTDFDGNVRTFAYNARGGLTDYTARGKHRHFEYDHRGRLSAIVDDDGVTRRVERDERGHIRRLSYSPSAKLSAFGLQAGPFRPLVDRRWAHALAPQDPPPDCCDDVITTDVWAPYWPGSGGTAQGVHGPLLDTPAVPPGGTTPPYNAIDCATALTLCFMGIMLYPVLVGALIAACPETFGLTCFGALVAMVGEPVLAILACAKAYEIC